MIFQTVDGGNADSTGNSQIDLRDPCGLSMPPQAVRMSIYSSHTNDYTKVHSGGSGYLASNEKVFEMFSKPL